MIRKIEVGKTYRELLEQSILIEDLRMEILDAIAIVFVSGAIHRSAIQLYNRISRIQSIQIPEAKIALVFQRIPEIALAYRNGTDIKTYPQYAEDYELLSRHKGLLTHFFLQFLEIVSEEMKEKTQF